MLWPKQIRTPNSYPASSRICPEIYDQFIKITDTLEKHYADMQDMEFTIEENKLYMLQTRAKEQLPLL